MTFPAAEFELGSDGPSLILIGVDGSRTSWRAAAYAAGLARRQRCRLLAVCVIRMPGTGSWGSLATRLVRAGKWPVTVVP